VSGWYSGSQKLYKDQDVINHRRYLDRRHVHAQRLSPVAYALLSLSTNYVRTRPRPHGMHLCIDWTGQDLADFRICVVSMAIMAKPMVTACVSLSMTYGFFSIQLGIYGVRRRLILRGC
jgi:hypothetical protein